MWLNEATRRESEVFNLKYSNLTRIWRVKFNSIQPPYTLSAGKVWRVGCKLSWLWSKTFSLILFVSCAGRKDKHCGLLHFCRISLGKSPFAVFKWMYTGRDGSGSYTEEDVYDGWCRDNSGEDPPLSVFMIKPIKPEWSGTENSTELVWWFMADANVKPLLPCSSGLLSCLTNPSRTPIPLFLKPSSSLNIPIRHLLIIPLTLPTSFSLQTHFGCPVFLLLAPLWPLISDFNGSLSPIAPLFHINPALCTLELSSRDPPPLLSLWSC